MQTIPLTIKAPIAGIQRRTAYQNTPPYTLYESVNFLPFDHKTGRAVLATRPGLTPVTTPGGSINFVERINAVVTGQPSESMVLNIGGDLYWWDGDGFTAATGAQAGSVTTGRAVFGATYLNETFICVDTGKPIVFNYTTGVAETIVETAGTCPSDTRFAVVWQGALWLFGSLANPHFLYASRIGDAHDFDFGVVATDLGRAFISTSSDTFGRLNGPVTAAVPISADAMVISTLGGGMSLAYRHPNQGGQLFPISDSLYILGQGAWTLTPDGTLFAMTKAGLITLAPSANAVPALISREKIPDELLGLDYNYENPKINLCYDSRFGGVRIAVRGDQEQAWFYDFATGGFSREEYLGYPVRLMEFTPFITSDASGVLFCGTGYGGLAIPDRFSTESFASSATIGPFKISPDANTRSIIQKSRFVFGRDTPSDGAVCTFTVVTGHDGQDAINRLLTGSDVFSYAVEASTLEDNNGVCYPRIAGHAAVINIEQAVGDLVLEEAQFDVFPAGKLRSVRSAQLATIGSPTVLPGDSTDFDSDLWRGYSGATPSTPNCTLPDHTHLVDLSRLPASWWAVVAVDGRDIRVTDEDNEPQPHDLIEWDYANTTGLLALKMTQTIPATGVRIWCGRDAVGAPAVTDTYGQYNAYDSNYKAFLPNAGGNDRTSNLNHLTLTGANDTCIVAGPIGNEGFDYTFLDATNNYGRAIAVVPTAAPVTLVVAAKDVDGTAVECFGLRDANGTSNFALAANRGGTNQSTTATTTDAAGLSGSANSGNLANASTWRHFAAVFTSSTSRTAYIAGGNAGTNATDRTPAGIDEIIIGKGSRSGLSSSSATLQLSLASVHNTDRSACWVDYQARMLDQTTFWGTWGELVEVNPVVPPADPPVTACPLGFVPVTEVGTWSGYAESTPVAPTFFATDWSHFIDLSTMPANWWSAVLTTGADIRATDSANVFVPFDLVNFDKTGNTGFIVVKLSQFPTSVQPIRLWVGNATAATVTACAPYGQYSAYDQYWRAFYPNGSGNDRTSHLNHLTSFGAPTSVTGPAGANATRFDGVTQIAIGDIDLPYAPTSILLVAAAKVNAPDYFDASLLVNLDDSIPYSICGLYQVLAYGPTNQDGHVRGSIKLRSNPTLGATASATFLAVDEWTLNAASFKIGNHLRAWHNDETGVFGDTVSWRGGTNTDFSRISVGGLEVLGTYGTVMDGDLAWVSIHDDIRQTSNTWVAYQYAMLDQATFFPGGWTWTAESSGLPQP